MQSTLGLQCELYNCGILGNKRWWACMERFCRHFEGAGLVYILKLDVRSHSPACYNDCGLHFHRQLVYLCTHFCASPTCTQTQSCEKLPHIAQSKLMWRETDYRSQQEFGVLTAVEFGSRCIFMPKLNQWKWMVRKRTAWPLFDDAFALFLSHSLLPSADFQ